MEQQDGKLQESVPLDIIPSSSPSPDIRASPLSSVPSPPPAYDNEYNTPDGRVWYYRWIVLFISTISLLLVSIQQNALIVSLPTVIDSLDASLTAMIWVLIVFSMNYFPSHPFLYSPSSFLPSVVPVYFSCLLLFLVHPTAWQLDISLTAISLLYLLVCSPSLPHLYSVSLCV
jgi:hypothetical protein